MTVGQLRGYLDELPQSMSVLLARDIGGEYVVPLGTYGTAVFRQWADGATELIEESDDLDMDYVVSNVLVAVPGDQCVVLYP